MKKLAAALIWVGIIGAVFGAQQFIDPDVPNSGNGTSAYDAAFIINENFTEVYDRTMPSVKEFGAVGDGATDDTVAVQAALDAGNVLFPDGNNFLLSSDINVPDGRTLVIDGTVSSSPGSTVQFHNKGSSRYVGNGSMNIPNPINRGVIESHNGDLYVEGITMKGEWPFTDLISIRPTNSNNDVITSVRILNTTLKDGRYGVFTQGNLNEQEPQPGPIIDVIIANNVITNQRGDGIIFNRSGFARRTIISGNTISRVGYRPGADTTSANQGFGIDVAGYGEISDDINDLHRFVDITDNVISGAANGIHLEYIANVNVANNIISDVSTNYTIGEAAYGIVCFGVRGFTMSGNQIHDVDNTARGVGILTGFNGQSLESDWPSYDFNFTDNVIVGGTNNVISAYKIGGFANIRGNTFQDTQGDLILRNGVTVMNFDGNQIVNYDANQLRGLTIDTWPDQIVLTNGVPGYNQRIAAAGTNRVFSMQDNIVYADDATTTVLLDRSGEDKLPEVTTEAGNNFSIPDFAKVSESIFDWTDIRQNYAVFPGSPQNRIQINTDSGTFTPGSGDFSVSFVIDVEESGDVVNGEGLFYMGESNLGTTLTEDYFHIFIRSGAQLAARYYAGGTAYGVQHDVNFYNTYNQSRTVRVGITKTASGMQIYLNGSPVLTEEFTGNVSELSTAISTSHIVLGVFGSGPMTGNLFFETLRVYDRELSPEEMAEEHAYGAVAGNLIELKGQDGIVVYDELNRNEGVARNGASFVIRNPPEISTIRGYLTGDGYLIAGEFGILPDDAVVVDAWVKSSGSPTFTIGHEIGFADIVASTSANANEWKGLTVFTSGAYLNDTNRRPYVDMTAGDAPSVFVLRYKRLGDL